MFIFNALIFTTVFVFFTLYKDYIIDTYYRETSNEKKRYITKRWLFFYFLGLISMFLFTL